MLHAPASYRQYAAGLAIALCCSNPAAGASQEQIAREMIQVLEAYAVYKMGDFDEAYSRYLTLAEAGNRQGMLNVGNMHAAGLAVPQNHETALRWYRRAADTGDAIGMYEVGRAYAEGLGVPPDAAKAAEWYQRAAELDNSSAQWALGKNLYAQGNRLAGLSWIRTAARQGDNPAATQFLSRIEGHNPGGTTPSAAQRAAVLDTLAAADSAAQRRDAQGIVSGLSPQAQIRVRLPGGAWDSLSKAQLAALWQATFDRVEGYESQRSEPELLTAEGRIMAFSTITEHLQAPGATQVLEIHENATLQLVAGKALIHSLRLDIHRQGE